MRIRAAALALILMRGPGTASSWTHLIPGLILGRVAAGLVTPPLASTALGVARPERAGMASGINSGRPPDTRAAVTALLDRDPDAVILAEHDGGLVSLAAIRRAFPGYGYVLTAYRWLRQPPFEFGWLRAEGCGR